ncbi:MAG: uncharacterized protein KVP18_001242 [Porospora cf. gigantea A]|uniref:uncharacterized protein n=1 Tax=Porospora cf. gigantea A TaxID=2853593 RepID=UPI003559EEB9|nr:MAG: hypothetical protein KVP18_001242 [Porospora cf. gigantea A]
MTQSTFERNLRRFSTEHFEYSEQKGHLVDALRLLRFQPPPGDLCASLNAERSPSLVNSGVVVGPSESTGRMYRQHVQPLLSNFLQGEGFAVVSVGLSGCGKTHSVVGSVEEAGILPHFLYDLLAATSSFTSFTGECSNDTTSEFLIKVVALAFGPDETVVDAMDPALIVSLVDTGTQWRPEGCSTAYMTCPQDALSWLSKLRSTLNPSCNLAIDVSLERCRLALKTVTRRNANYELEKQISKNPIACELSHALFIDTVGMECLATAPPGNISLFALAECLLQAASRNSDSGGACHLPTAMSPLTQFLHYPLFVRLAMPRAPVPATRPVIIVNVADFCGFCRGNQALINFAERLGSLSCAMTPHQVFPCQSAWVAETRRHRQGLPSRVVAASCIRWQDLQADKLHVLSVWNEGWPPPSPPRLLQYFHDYCEFVRRQDETNGSSISVSSTPATYRSGSLEGPGYPVENFQASGSLSLDPDQSALTGNPLAAAFLAGNTQWSVHMQGTTQCEPPSA